MNTARAFAFGASATALLALTALAPTRSSAGAQTAADEGLQPRTSFDGPALELDFPGLRIGVAEYEEGPTGVTVFHFPDKVKAAVDVRGGAPGTVNTDGLRLGYESRMVDAVVFAGGSSYGLAAAGGVAEEIKARGGAGGDWTVIAEAVSAIIFDLGGRRLNTVTPDFELGRAALRAAVPGRFPLGARGAGRFAMQGVYFANENYTNWSHSGQGGAFRQIGPTKIAVFAVVNAMGTVVDREGNVVRCHATDPTAQCGKITEWLAETGRRLDAQATESTSADPDPAPTPGPTSNTTITLVATNQKLPFWALQRLAVQVHMSMSRAIQPFSTQDDGDVLYAVTTDEVDNPGLSPMNLGVLAAEVAWDAVLASVPSLPDTGPTAPLPASATDPRGLEGTYAFAPDALLTVRRSADALVARFTGRPNLYFPVDREVVLRPVGDGEFLLQTPRRDRLRFEGFGGGDAAAGAVVLNPGPWAQRAARETELR